MGQLLSVSWGRQNRIDLKTGLTFHKILPTEHADVVTSLRIQPSGYLVAVADESGRLLIFDLPSTDVVASQSLHLLQEHGGISELCWLGDDIIAVGTTRGKIIVFSSRNTAGRFSRVCDVEAHGDGFLQVAVECMEFASGIRCLASVGHGKNSVRLWDVDDSGTLRPRATGDSLPEYTSPRFVGFANNDTELLVGYLEHAIVRRYSINPWQLLERKYLNQGDELGAASDNKHKRNYIGNALLLPRTQQLAVHNWENGLDIYGYPDLVCKHVSRYKIASGTSQALASFRSGKFLASPTIAGRILIFDTCDASVLTTLQTSRSRTFQAVDALTIPVRNAEYVVGASIGKGVKTCIMVWRRNVQSRDTALATRASHSSSLIWQLAIALLVYLLCTFVPPVLLKVMPDGLVWSFTMDLIH